MKVHDSLSLYELVNFFVFVLPILDLNYECRYRLAHAMITYTVDIG